MPIDTHLKLITVFKDYKMENKVEEFDLIDSIPKVESESDGESVENDASDTEETFFDLRTTNSVILSTEHHQNEQNDDITENTDRKKNSEIPNLNYAGNQNVKIGSRGNEIKQEFTDETIQSVEANKQNEERKDTLEMSEKLNQNSIHWNKEIGINEKKNTKTADNGCTNNLEFDQKIVNKIEEVREFIQKSDDNLNSDHNSCIAAEQTSILIPKEATIQQEGIKNEIEQLDSHRLYSNILKIRSSWILSTMEEWELWHNKSNTDVTAKCVLCWEYIWDNWLLRFASFPSNNAKSSSTHEIQFSSACNSCGATFSLK